jgi:hypothetical protein
MVAGWWAAGEVLVMSHARVAFFAALLGFALNGPADPSRLATGLHVWLSSVCAEAGSIMDPNGVGSAQGDEGGIMDPNGRNGAQGDEGSIMDPDG